MKILHNIAGMAGSQAAIWLAIGAIAFLLTGEGAGFEAAGYTSGNF